MAQPETDRERRSRELIDVATVDVERRLRALINESNERYGNTHPITRGALRALEQVLDVGTLNAAEVPE